VHYYGLLYSIYFISSKLNKMKTYTIDQFKKYLQTQDSLGDIYYNLSEANIDIANLPDELISEDDDMEMFPNIMDSETGLG
jgi:hypothetical protein